MKAHGNIAPIITIGGLHDRSRDAAWWLTQPPSARIAAVEEIRREFHEWKFGAEPGFQRLYSVTKR